MKRKSPLITQAAPGVKLYSVYSPISHQYWGEITSKMPLKALVQASAGIGLNYEELGQLAYILSSKDPIKAAESLGWATRINE